MKQLNVFLFLFLLFSAVSSDAQAILPTPRPPIVIVPRIQDPALDPLRVSSGDAEIRITGLLARAVVTYTVSNPNARQLEAEFQFPLPPGATVTGLALDVDGQMLDAAILPKTKAKAVFEAVERQNLDPALVESVGANTYRVRVWPVPAHGTRKVRIEFVSELIPAGGEAVFTLPMRFTDKLDSMRLRITVADPSVLPEVTGNEFAGMHFDKWESQLAAERTLRDLVLSEDLRIAVPHKPAPVRLEKSEDGLYFRAEQPAPPVKAAKRAESSALNLVWDASLSRKTQDHEAEFELLKTYFKDKTLDVDLYILRDTLSAQPVRFSVQNGDASALLAELAKTVYDGGTNLAALRPLFTGQIPSLVLTDGADNFGPGIEAFTENRNAAPVDFVTCTSQADTAVLAYLARLGRGHALNLTRTTPAEAAAALDWEPETVPSVTVTADGKPVRAEIQVIGGFLIASGKVPAETKELVIAETQVIGEFLTASGKVLAETKELVIEGKTISLDAEKIASGDLLRTAWSLMKLESMKQDPRTKEEDFIAHGQTYGIVTPGTSMLVLDSYDLYKTHRVRPPASLAQWQARYDREVREEKPVVKDLKSVMARYRQEIGAWYETAVPEHRPASTSKNVKSERRRGVVNAFRSALGVDSARRSEAADEDGMVANEAPAAGAAREAEPAAPRKPKSSDTNGPSVKVNAWDPKTPYLAAMRAVNDPDRAYAIYLEYRDKDGGSVGLFTDCADFFRQADRPELARRILSNLAEMELESTAILRVLAMRLRLTGDLDAAERVYRKVLRLSPEEPQSYRDLALTLDDAGRFAEAAELYLRIIQGDFDRRFPGIDLIAVTELNRVAARAERAGKKLDLDPVLCFPLEAAFRVVLAWDTDLSDMDLHVTDPWDEDCFYGHRRTVGGGHLSFDFTQGYGPEEFMTRKLLPGKYRVWTHYYGQSSVKRIGPVTLYAVLYTNYGMPDEKRETLTFRLGDRNERVEIATVEGGTSADNGPKGPRDYQVKAGDTLWSIALRELGDGARAEEIKTLNNLNSDKIRPGDILKLPAR
ncbi:MAG: DUF2135 domain-containing protein [Lentisphaeria bacterium]|nr:DUF2135 domain-containing protein [Lentisphaeria bacterium]